MITYTDKQLPDILEEMADYVRSCGSDGGSLAMYFEEIIKTGLFHDACGKIVNIVGAKVFITEDYGDTGNLHPKGAVWGICQNYISRSCLNNHKRRNN